MTATPDTDACRTALGRYAELLMIAADESDAGNPEVSMSPRSESDHPKVRMSTKYARELAAALTAAANEIDPQTDQEGTPA
jgi:hypothetical protein